MNNSPILKMINIEKSFPGVKALTNAQLIVKRGTVHALMGENGAGKSTLMKILIGMYHKDSGEIWFDGKLIENASVSDMLKKGISMIFQELNPIPYMSVAENIYVGREPKQKNKIFVDRKKILSDARNLLKKLQIDDVRADAKVADLNIAQIQMVEIAKAVSYNSKLIIMDEPTSSLTQVECENLFRIIESLKKQGISFIYISHKMEEIYRVCDEITVMRDGQYILTGKTNELSQDELIHSMVGRRLSTLFPKQDNAVGNEILRVEHLTSKNRFTDISFNVYKGEILGFAGLVGAGRTEVMESVFGYKPSDSGNIFINEIPRCIRKPQDAIRYKMGFLTEDRKKTGIFQPLNLTDNIIMPSIGKYKTGPFIRKKEVKRKCLELIRKFSIKTPGLETIINNLSGGNQQKVLLARWMETNPDILILDEPTSRQ